MLNESSKDFIRMANEDLNALEDLKYFDFRSANIACFHAQQYAEKMIKARRLELDMPVERSHNLLYLLEDFEASEGIDKARDYCRTLSQYEARTRYPIEGATIFTPEDAEEAYDMAVKIPYLIGLYQEDSEENLTPDDCRR